MIADAIGACSVIIYKAEVVGRGGEDFGYAAKGVEALWEGTGFAGVAVWRHRLGGGFVEYRARGQKERGVVNAENGGARRGWSASQPSTIGMKECSSQTV